MHPFPNFDRQVLQAHRSSGTSRLAIIYSRQTRKWSVSPDDSPEPYTDQKRHRAAAALNCMIASLTAPCRSSVPEQLKNVQKCIDTSWKPRWAHRFRHMHMLAQCIRLPAAPPELSLPSALDVWRRLSLTTSFAVPPFTGVFLRQYRFVHSLISGG